LKASGQSNGLQLSQLTSDGGSSISATNNNYLKFSTNATERMRIASSGYVGIGTSSPSTNLQIEANDNLTTTFPVKITNSAGSGFTELGCYAINTSAVDLVLQAGGNEGLRIDKDNGKVGIGTSSPTEKLEVSDGKLLIKTTSGAASLEIVTPGGSADSLINFGDSADNNVGIVAYEHDNNAMKFIVNTFERVRINSTGHVLVGTTNESPAVNNVNGAVIKRAGYASEFTGEGGLALQINRKANNGTLVSFRQDGTQEGSISVSGTTVSYNGFTGTHWSRFQDNSTPIILKGTVLESLDEMCDWYNLEFDVNEQDDDGNDVTYTKKVPHVLLDTQSNGDVITYNHEGTDYQATIVKEVDVKHMKSKVSDTVDAKNVYGLFVAYDLDGEGYNDFYVASVGSYVVRIKQGETIAKGDLLQSNGDGTAKVQTDDNIKSSSFAKVLSTTIIETYEDGSYLVPCSLNC